MSKKLYAALLPILAVAAFAVIPAVASAATVWEANGVTLPLNGTKTFVNGYSKELKLVDKTIVSGGLEVKCEVYVVGKVWNPASGNGMDEITQFVTENPCKTNIAGCTVGVSPEKTPWPSELGAGPIDTIKGIQVTVKVGSAAACGGLAGGSVTYTGELSPKVANGNGIGKAECAKSTGNKTTFAEFTAATGTLASSLSTKGEIIGNVCIWGSVENEVIKA